MKWLLLLLASNAYAACDPRISSQWDYTTLAPICGATSLQENGGTSVRVTTTVCGPTGRSFSMVSDLNALFVSTGVTNVAAASSMFAFDGYVYPSAFTNAVGCIWCASAGYSVYVSSGQKLAWASGGGTLTGASTLSLNTCYYYAFFKNTSGRREIWIKENPVGTNFVATLDASDAVDGSYTTGNLIHGRGFGAGSFIVGFLNLPAFWVFTTAPSSFPPQISNGQRSSMYYNRQRNVQGPGLPGGLRQ